MSASDYMATARAALAKWVSGLNACLEGRSFVQQRAIEGVLTQVLETWERALRAALQTADLEAFVAQNHEVSERPSESAVTTDMIRQNEAQLTRLQRDLQTLDEESLRREIADLEALAVRFRETLSLYWRLQLDLVDLEGAVETQQGEGHGKAPDVIDVDMELLRTRARCLEFAAELRG